MFVKKRGLQWNRELKPWNSYFPSVPKKEVRRKLNNHGKTMTDKVCAWYLQPLIHLFLILECFYNKLPELCVHLGPEEPICRHPVIFGKYFDTYDMWRTEPTTGQLDQKVRTEEGVVKRSPDRTNRQCMKISEKWDSLSDNLS